MKDRKDKMQGHPPGSEARGQGVLDPRVKLAGPTLVKILAKSNAQGMRLTSMFLLFLLLAACATKTIAPTPVVPTQPTPSPEFAPTGEEGDESAVDLRSLMVALGMQRDPADLGYHEKSFQSCEVGYGFSKTHHCRQLFLAVIHYRLQCRDSEGTISTTLGENDVRSIANKDITWSLKGKKGTSPTDPAGQGEIITFVSAPAKMQRLKLTMSGEFLYLRAGEISRVITPKSWCDLL